MNNSLLHSDLTSRIIAACMDVHSELGPGLLESVYQECVFKSLLHRGLTVKREVVFPIYFKSELLDKGYRVDFLVEDTIILELKSVNCIEDIHIAQVLTYLKLSEKEVGLLVNFNTVHLKTGIRRLVFTNNHSPKIREVNEKY